MDRDAHKDLIEQDGFEADERVFMLIEGETPGTMAKSTGLGLLDFQATRWTMDKKIPPQEGNNHPTNTPMGLYPTANGFLNLAATSNKNFQKFCKLIDREKLATDPRFADFARRAAVACVISPRSGAQPRLNVAVRASK